MCLPAGGYLELQCPRLVRPYQPRLTGTCPSRWEEVICVTWGSKQADPGWGIPCRVPGTSTTKERVRGELGSQSPLTVQIPLSYDLGTGRRPAYIWEATVPLQAEGSEESLASGSSVCRSQVQVQREQQHLAPALDKGRVTPQVSPHPFSPTRSS